MRAARMFPAAAAIVAVLTIYVLRLDSAAGLMVDDAWYVLLAKALAEGSGYRLVSSAAEAILPLYPPGFPALLSLVFRVDSGFPANVWLLKSVSIAAMFGVGLLSYRYFSRYRGVSASVAIWLAGAVVLTPGLVFLATSTLMTECVFTLVQLASVLAIHRSVDETPARRGTSHSVLAAVLAAAAVLIRSSGVAVVIAGLAWYSKERLWKPAALFSVTAALCLCPWMLYARVHAPSPSQRAAHGGAIVHDYSDQFWMRWAGTEAAGRVTVGDLPARVRTNFIDIFGRDMVAIMAPTFLRAADESGEEVIAVGGALGLSTSSMGSAPITMVISFFLSGLVLLGFLQAVITRVTVSEILVPIALAIVLVWPFWSFRFVLPLVPYLFLYFIEGIAMVVRWIRVGPLRRVEPASVCRIVIMCLIGLNLYDHAGYILLTRGNVRPSADWITGGRDVDELVDWMNQYLVSDGAVATINPALIYLRTGRKAIMFDERGGGWNNWKKYGVRYVVAVRPAELPDRARGDYKILYKSPARLWVIEI
jgi:hypothetical protein